MKGIVAGKKVHLSDFQLQNMIDSKPQVLCSEATLPMNCCQLMSRFTNVDGYLRELRLLIGATALQVDFGLSTLNWQ